MAEPLSRPQQLAALALAALALICPVIMVFAPKVPALLVPLAALCMLPALRVRLGREYLFWVAVLLALVIPALVRTPLPERAMGFVFHAVVEVGSGLVLVLVALRLPVASLRIIVAGLGVGVFLAFVALVIEHAGGQAIANAIAAGLHRRPPFSYSMDRSLILFSLLFWPLMATGMSTGYLRWPFVAGAGILLFAVLAQTNSQASVAGLAFGLLVFVCANLAPRLSYRMLRLGVIGLFLGMPFLIYALTIIFNNDLVIWNAANARERLGIWTSTTINILDRPWTGYGIEALPVLPGTINNLHCHNGILQMWIEFGLPGVVVLLAGVLVLLRHVKGRPVVQAAFASWLLIFSVGYNYWQPWWIATALLACSLLVVAERFRRQVPERS